jgi:hypothetical protein
MAASVMPARSQARTASAVGADMATRIGAPQHCGRLYYLDRDPAGDRQNTAGGFGA